MALNATTQTYADILRPKVDRPANVVAVTDKRVVSGGPNWRGKIKPTGTDEFDILALTSAESWAEVTWSAPSTAVGVQFAGNQDDGWAKITVDGEEVWQGNTFGDAGKFNRYVEIANLPSAPHTVRVEAVGKIGTENGGIDVTVTAFGWGAVSTDNMVDTSSKIYNPLVFGG